MLHMRPKILKNSPSGKISVFISSNSNSIFSNLHNMILTLRPTISPLLLALKSFIIKPINLSLEQKHPQNFILQNHKFTSPFSYLSQYSVNHLFTIDQSVAMTQLNNNTSSFLIVTPLVLFSFPKKHSISMMIFFTNTHTH